MLFVTWYTGLKTKERHCLFRWCLRVSRCSGFLNLKFFFFFFFFFNLNHLGVPSFPLKLRNPGEREGTSSWPKSRGEKVAFLPKGEGAAAESITPTG
jgi:hypothetical protein